MIKLIFNVFLLSLLLFFSVFAQEIQGEAQESGEGIRGDSVSEYSDSEVVGDDKLSVFSEEQGLSRPAVIEPMGSLFFSPTQRRILEVVRRGVLRDQEITDLGVQDRSSPLLLIKEGLSEEEEAQSRDGVVKVDAFIRNRSSGKASIWLNGTLVIIDEGGSEDSFLSENGLTISDDIDENNIIQGSDYHSQSRFKVKVGQIIGIDGHIDESLPVVTKK